mmetsp:Transcript_42517/g.90565  ORF Transcript_42517/g.90565 Transcript_42517/m.90565 type:complete len:320 (+) Transcript_42517:1088-2047(+)
MACNASTSCPPGEKAASRSGAGGTATGVPAPDVATMEPQTRGLSVPPGTGQAEAWLGIRDMILGDTGWLGARDGGLGESGALVAATTGVAATTWTEVIVDGNKRGVTVRETGATPGASSSTNFPALCTWIGATFNSPSGARSWAVVCTDGAACAHDGMACTTCTVRGEPLGGEVGEAATMRLAWERTDCMGTTGMGAGDKRDADAEVLIGVGVKDPTGPVAVAATWRPRPSGGPGVSTRAVVNISPRVLQTGVTAEEVAAARPARPAMGGTRKPVWPLGLAPAGCPLGGCGCPTKKFWPLIPPTRAGWPTLLTPPGALM